MESLIEVTAEQYNKLRGKWGQTLIIDFIIT